MHDNECIDPEVLAELRSLDPTGEVLPTLLTQFLAETPQRLTAMRKALTKGDGIGMANTAHALKGSSGNMGAVRMLNLCNDLEAVCRANDLTAVKRLLDCLESDFAFVRVVLLQEQDRLSSMRHPNSSR